MNIREFFNSGANITLAVTLNDLKDFHDFVIENTKTELEHTIIESKAESYLSPENVCSILDIDRSTLWRWNKTGYLPHIEIGGKRRYKRSSIDKLLNR